MAPNDLIFSCLKNVSAVNDEVVETYRNFTNAKDSYSRHLRRSIENWRFYVGVDADLGYGQWPEKAVSFMLSQGRQLLTYNFVKPLVDRVAGGLMSVPFSPEFYPVGEDMTSLTDGIKKAMYSDKEIMDWGGAYLQLVKAGLIFDGVIKMVVSDEYNPLGNIGFEYCLPGTVTPDPMWRTWRSKDQDVCWHEQWLQPDKIIELWPSAEPLLRAQLHSLQTGGPQYGNTSGPTPFVTSDGNTWGSAQRVISQYKMETRKYTQEYCITPDGDKPIPMQLKALDQKIQWLNDNIPEWRPEFVYEKPEKERICVVTRICPAVSFNSVIEKNLPEVQVGRLPYFFWSASRDNGEPHSIVDSVKDAQLNINYWESLITHKIQVEGGGGSQFVDRAGFANDEEFDRYKVMRNNPAEAFEVRPNYLSTGAVPARPTLNTQIPRDAYEHLNHIIGTLLPHISKVTPASKGLPEAGPTSGYLYKLMTLQSEQQVYTIHYGLRIFWNEVYEAYLMQAANTYSNERLPRKFGQSDGNTVILNELVTLPDGRKAIKNDVAQLKTMRHKVIISEAQDTPTKKIEDLQVMSEYISRIPKDKPATLQYIINRTTSLIDQFSQEDKDRLEKLGEKELALAEATVEAGVIQAQINLATLKSQLMQLQQSGGMSPQQGPQSQGQQGGLTVAETQLPEELLTQGAMPQAAQPNNIRGPQAQGVMQ